MGGTIDVAGCIPNALETLSAVQANDGGWDLCSSWLPEEVEACLPPSFPGHL